MNPEADDLYERLGVDPVASMADVNKQLSRFQLEHGKDYPEQKTELERTLKNPESRREYNRNEGYPTDWESVGEVVELQLKGPDVVEKNDPVTVTVTDEAGDPLSGADIDVGGTDLGETDEHGRCSFSFDAPGEAIVTASKATSGDRSFRDATLEINITNERRELTATADPSSASVGEPVTITVTDGTGPVEGALVETPDGPERTDSDGVCTVTFDTKGAFDLDVDKDEEKDVTYISTSVGVDIDPERVTLELSTDTSTATVGDTIGFTVTDGTDGVGDATVTTGRERDTTDGSGHVSLEFTKAGPVTVEAEKSDDATRIYDGDAIEIDVERREVDLLVDLDDHVEVGEPVTITVTDGTSPIADAQAEIVGGDDKATTDGDGECRLRFSELGPATVAATKATTEAARYNRGKGSTTVERASRSLEVTPEGGTVTGGKPIEFLVEDDAGNQIADAEIETPSGTYRTGRHGTCEVSFETAGSVDVTVRKDDTDTTAYANKSVSFTVERRNLDLAVTTDRDTVKSGSGVDVIVYDETGDRVEDAVVSCGKQRETTDSNGRCRLHPSREGNLEIRARKDDEPTIQYGEDVTMVSVYFEKQALTLEADDVADAGTTTTVRVTDEDGNPVTDAIVESPLGQHSTDTDGTATVPLPDADAANLTARRGLKEGVRWTDDTARLELKGATDDRDTGTTEDGIGTTSLFLSIGVIVGIPVVASLILFAPDVGMTTVLGGIVSIVMLVMFGIVLTER